MDETSRSNSEPALQLETAVARIAELERLLDEQRLENGVLRLQLDVLSTTDIVTGLPNVTGIVQILENALARHSRSGESFGVMAVNVPALATIGERYGKDHVKDALRHSGAMVSAGLRQLDSVGRLDDTTFLVALPMLGREGVGAVIERIERMLESVPMTFGDDSVHMEPAISLVLIAPGEAPEIDQVLSTLFDARERAVPGTPAIEVVRRPE